MKKLLLVLCLIIVMVIFKDCLLIGLMDIVDFIGNLFNLNVVSLIDFLNNLYYLQSENKWDKICPTYFFYGLLYTVFFIMYGELCLLYIVYRLLYIVYIM